MGFPRNRKKARGDGPKIVSLVRVASAKIAEVENLLLKEGFKKKGDIFRCSRDHAAAAVAATSVEREGGCLEFLPFFSWLPSS